MGNKAWKQRYMVLYDGILEYFDNYYYYKESLKNGTKQKNKNSKNEHEINLKEVKSFKVITTNETSKKSDREYTFQLITASRTYTISCQHKQQFNKWTKLIEQQVYGQIITKGYIFRQGDVRKNKWKKQYFILYNSKKLMYYENDQKIKNAKGVINLQQINGLSKTEETIIEIKTNSKIYALKCLNEKDLKQWFDAILKVMKTDNSKPKTTKLSMSQSEANISTKTEAKSPKFLAANSLFQKQISIDFTLSDNDENELPESGKFFEDKPAAFKFSSDIEKDKENKIKKNIQHTKGTSINLSEIDTVGNNEYRKIQIELNKEWQRIMKDVVIDKHHSLAMDAMSNFCVAKSKEIEAQKKRISAQTPISPKSADSTLLASIPKMKSAKSYTKSRESSGSLIPSFESDGILESFEFADSSPPDLEKLASMTIPKKIKLQNSNTPISTMDDDGIDIPEFPEAMFSAKSEMFIDIEADERKEDNAKNRKRIKKEEKMKLFANCACISRLVIILRAYEQWMQYKTEHEEQMNDNEGFRGMISVLSDYNLSDLLNDYYHIKRFHVESTKKSKNSNSDNVKTGVLDPDICSFLKKNISKCNVMKCLCFQRNINEKSKENKDK